MGTGALVGVAGLALALAPRARRLALPLVALGAAALLLGDDRAPVHLLIAVALLGAAELVLDRPPVALTLAGGGTIVLASSVERAGTLPSGLLAACTLLVAAWALPRLPTAFRPPGAALAVAGVAFGIYLAVPDTEEIRLAAAAILPALMLVLAMAGRAPTGCALGPLGVLAWAAAQGGRGHPSAVVGALACLALLAVAPLVVRRAPRTTPVGPASAAMLLTVQAAAVIAACRVAAPQPNARTAGVLVVGVTLGALALDGFVFQRVGARSTRAD